MGSGDCTVETTNSPDLAPSSFGKLDKVVSMGETGMDVIDPLVLLMADEAIDSLGPITPDLERESDNLAYFDSKSNKNEVNALGLADDSRSPHTPLGGVFDPFAPGPENLVLAPQCRKCSGKSRSIVARRLDFDSSMREIVETEDNSFRKDTLLVSDEDIVEAMYTSLLETIVSKQKESFLSQISSINDDFGDCKTPPLSSRLIGPLDTCPGAPLRPSRKSRNNDLGLCRKLQFSP